MIGHRLNDTLTVYRATDTRLNRDVALKVLPPELMSDADRRERFVRDYALPAYDAGVLTVERPLADYFEAVAKATKATPKIAANWVMGELASAMNRDGVGVGAARVTAATLAALLDKIAADQKYANEVLKVNSTPTFFINGDMVKGEIAFEDFKKKIDPLLKN